VKSPTIELIEDTSLPSSQAHLHETPTGSDPRSSTRILENPEKIEVENEDDELLKLLYDLQKEKEEIEGEDLHQDEWLGDINEEEESVNIQVEGKHTYEEEPETKEATQWEQSLLSQSIIDEFTYGEMDDLNGSAATVPGAPEDGPSTRVEAGTSSSNSIFQGDGQPGDTVSSDESKGSASGTRELRTPKRRSIRARKSSLKVRSSERNTPKTPNRTDKRRSAVTSPASSHPKSNRNDRGMPKNRLTEVSTSEKKAPKILDSSVGNSSGGLEAQKTASSTEGSTNTHVPSESANVMGTKRDPPTPSRISTRIAHRRGSLSMKDAPPTTSNSKQRSSKSHKSHETSGDNLSQDLNTCRPTSVRRASNTAMGSKDRGTREDEPDQYSKTTSEFNAPGKAQSKNKKLASESSVKKTTAKSKESDQNKSDTSQRKSVLTKPDEVDRKVSQPAGPKISFPISIDTNRRIIRLSTPETNPVIEIEKISPMMIQKVKEVGVAQAVKDNPEIIPISVRSILGKSKKKAAVSSSSHIPEPDIHSVDSEPICLDAQVSGSSLHPLETTSKSQVSHPVSEQMPMAIGSLKKVSLRPKRFQNTINSKRSTSGSKGLSTEIELTDKSNESFVDEAAKKKAVVVSESGTNIGHRSSRSRASTTSSTSLEVGKIAENSGTTSGTGTANKTVVVESDVKECQPGTLSNLANVHENICDPYGDDNSVSGQMDLVEHVRNVTSTDSYENEDTAAGKHGSTHSNDSAEFEIDPRVKHESMEAIFMSEAGNNIEAASCSTVDHQSTLHKVTTSEGPDCVAFQISSKDVAAHPSRKGTVSEKSKLYQEENPATLRNESISLKSVVAKSSSVQTSDASTSLSITSKASFQNSGNIAVSERGVVTRDSCVQTEPCIVLGMDSVLTYLRENISLAEILKLVGKEDLLVTASQEQSSSELVISRQLRTETSPTPPQDVVSHSQSESVTPLQRISSMNDRFRDIEELINIDTTPCKSSISIINSNYSIEKDDIFPLGASKGKLDPTRSNTAGFSGNTRESTTATSAVSDSSQVSGRRTPYFSSTPPVRTPTERKNDTSLGFKAFVKRAMDLHKKTEVSKTELENPPSPDPPSPPRSPLSMSPVDLSVESFYDFDSPIFEEPEDDDDEDETSSLFEIKKQSSRLRARQRRFEKLADYLEGSATAPDIFEHEYQPLKKPKSFKWVTKYMNKLQKSASPARNVGQPETTRGNAHKLTNDLDVSSEEEEIENVRRCFGESSSDDDEDGNSSLKNSSSGRATSPTVFSPLSGAKDVPLSHSVGTPEVSKKSSAAVKRKFCWEEESDGPMKTKMRKIDEPDNLHASVLKPADRSELDGPSLKNQFGFEHDMSNLQDAKAISHVREY
jgi:hypothetical protein